METDFFDDNQEEIIEYKRNTRPLNLNDICFYEKYAAVYSNNGVTCTDGEKQYYIDSISYDAAEGFVFNLVETM